MTVNSQVCSLLCQTGQPFLKRGVASANLSSSGNVPFLKDLFIISVNIGKYVSTESIRTFTGIQELMADFFLFKGFMTFFTSSGDNTFKRNFSATL